jgi:hypothetical protein
VISAYAGWAFDEVDDAREERRMLWVLGLIAVLFPLLIVLGRQALGTAFDDAPGSWPRWADAVARSVISIPSVALGAVLLVRLARTGKGTAAPIIAPLIMKADMYVVRASAHHRFIELSQMTSAIRAADTTTIRMASVNQRFQTTRLVFSLIATPTVSLLQAWRPSTRPLETSSWAASHPSEGVPIDRRCPEKFERPRHGQKGCQAYLA